MGVHAGIDLFGFPGKQALKWLKMNTNIEWTGFYLAPAPSHGNMSWMPHRNDIIDAGFGIAPIYVGQETIGPGRHNVNGQQGLVDGRNASVLMQNAGFPKGSTVFLDLENGLPFPMNQHAYVKEWVAAVEANGFKAGVYCSFTFAAQLHSIVPTAAVWAFHVATTQQHRVPGPHYPDMHPAGCGFTGAALWQCAQNCIIECPPVGHLNVDLDTSIWRDPSQQT